MTSDPQLLGMMGAVALAALAAALLAWRAPAWLVRHGWLALGVPLLVSLAAVLALVDFGDLSVRTRMDASEEPMLADGDPTRPVYAHAVRDFGDDDVLVVVMTARDVFTVDNLSALERIDTAVRRLPGVRGTESLVHTTTFGYDTADDMVRVEPLVDDIPRDADELAALRRRALDEPLHARTVVGDQGRAAAINVTFVDMSDDAYVTSGLEESIADILAAEAAPGRGFHVTGRKHIKSEAHHRMVHDLVRLIPLAVLVGALIAGVVTGSLRAAVVPVGSSLVATLWAYAALAWLGRPLNLITLVLGPTLICVGSVYGVHVLARFEEFCGRIPDRREAAVTTLAYVRLPVAVAALTTCLGFGSLLLSSTPAIRELGLFSLLGVACVAAIALTAVPALLARLPAAPSLTRRPPVLLRAVDRVLARIAGLVVERPGVVLAAWGLASAAAAVAVLLIVVDTDYLSFFDADSRVRRDFAAASELVGGGMPVYVTLTSEQEGAFREPDAMRALERLQKKVAAMAGVDTTLSVADFVRRLNRAIEFDDPAAAVIPDTRGLVAEVLFLIPKDVARRYVTSNHSAVNLVVRTGWTGSARIRELESGIRRAAAESDIPPGIELEVTGNTVVLNHAADGIAGNQLTTVGVATVSILVLMAWAFRSARIGALAMIPNLVPVLLFFGALGAGVATLSLPTSLIGCIALGIAIDDTAHFLVGYRNRRATGMSPEHAAEDCITNLGRPIVVTSLMLVGGFSVLGLSGFATLREFGQLASVTMVLCLAADLALLPAILVRARV